MTHRFDWEERSESTPFLLHAAAGSCAGWTEHSITYPLDTLKTRIQASRGHVPRTSLFRGLPAVLAASVPAHASLFSVYELAKRNSWLENVVGTDIAAAVAGGLSITAHDLIMTPADVVKQRLQLGGGYKGVAHCVTQVLRTEGIKALYRSLPVTLFMNVPNTGIMLAIHERIKAAAAARFNRPAADNNQFPPLSMVVSHFGSAGVAGALAAAATTPLDVIKTRMQTQRVRMISTKPPHSARPWLSQPAFYSRGATSTPKYATASSTLKILLREEGFPVLFRGALPRAMVAAPGTALCWGGYELSKNVLALLFGYT